MAGKLVKEAVPFVKLEGAGNTLLLVESKVFPRKNSPDFVRAITSKGLGLDADQLIEVVSWSRPEIKVWNRDGTRAEMCSNGTRVFLAWAKHTGFFRPRSPWVTVKVEGKNYRARDCGRQFALELPAPVLGPREVLKVNGKRIQFVPVSVGNPHAVLRMGEDVPLALLKQDWTKLGAALEVHQRFPKRTNVEFVGDPEIFRGRGRASVLAWERGAGATLSCGSGAVAVAALLHRESGVKDWTVQMTRYELKVKVTAQGFELRGPWKWIASGFFNHGSRTKGKK